MGISYFSELTNIIFYIVKARTIQTLLKNARDEQYPINQKTSG